MKCAQCGADVSSEFYVEGRNRICARCARGKRLLRALGLVAKAEGPLTVGEAEAPVALQDSLSVVFREISGSQGQRVTEAQFRHEGKPILMSFDQQSYVSDRLGVLGAGRHDNSAGGGVWFATTVLRELCSKLVFRSEGKVLKGEAEVKLFSPHGDFDDWCSFVLDLEALTGRYKESSSLDVTQ